MITADQVKELRNKTGISVMQCKRALEDAGGDLDKAVEILKTKGAEITLKKGGRALQSGTIAAYIHGNGAIGAMVELSCETDFVARNEEFKALAHDIAMHIAAMAPEFINEKEVTNKEKKSVRELFLKEIEESGKPDDVKKKMLTGKVSTYFKEKTLLSQQFVKEPNQTIADLLIAIVQKFGERIEVAKFERFII